jgi:hypothetical protein
VNSIVPHKIAFCLPGLTAITVLVGSLAANAQTIEPNPNSTLANPVNSTTSVTTNGATQKESTNSVFVPVPGSAETSSTGLSPEYRESTSGTSTTNVAQSEPTPQPKVKVGRSTRGGSSYIGLGGNIGIDGGSSSLSDGNFAIISKIGLTKNFSFRPGAVLGDNATILLPVTLDFPLGSVGDQVNEPQGIAPYVGVGAAIKTGDNSDAAVLVTGGIDVPLNQQFTANVALNAAFFDQTDVGVILGVGYNFTGF